MRVLVLFRTPNGVTVRSTEIPQSWDGHPIIPTRGDILHYGETTGVVTSLEWNLVARTIHVFVEVQ